MSYLVGTKSDLIAKREVSYDEAVYKAKEFKIDYFEVSSKNGINVKETFTTITSFLMN